MNAQDSTVQSADRSHHVIFVDGVGEEHKQTYESDIVDAATIIAAAGYEEEPDQYILEALRGQSGAVVKEFDPQGDAGPSEVDFTEQHREHLRVTTRGDVFI